MGGEGRGAAGWASETISLEGEMGDLVRAKDWASTPLGPPGTWSQALRTMVGLLLRNRFPMLLWWGPRFVQIYNDAYVPIPGAKHPRALGQTGSECWSEIWHVIGPMVEAPFRGEPATTSDDLELMLRRRGFLEETHFKIAYSPVPDETAPSGIGGVLATVAETTEEVYAGRQLRTLRDLSARAAEAKTPAQACESAAATLRENGADVPFALLYLLEPGGRTARLAASTGFAGRHAAAAPALIDLPSSGGAGSWPLAELLERRAPAVVGDLAARFAALPPGRWSEPPQSALVLPLASPGHELPYGVLIAGVSPHRRLDEGYRAFLELAASQVVTAIRNARAHEEERRRAETLAELDRAKTEFFGDVSHEFRTPLTLMLGPLADALADAAEPLGPAQRERLEIARRNGLRLHKLVDSLLDFSRLEAGRARASFEETDLAALTGDLASVFRSAVERAGLRLSVDCPPLGEPVRVDREMWEKIVLNLLSNALKFTFEGEIAVSLRRRERAVELAVRDTGTGIAPEDQRLIFERFQRVRGARARTHEGSGIGLALVQELARLHGGDARVESEPGRGSTFTVTLPLARGSSAGGPPVPAPRPGIPGREGPAAAYVEESLRWLPEETAPPPSNGRARILVADDNADMRVYLTRILERRWAVEAVSDGDAALEAARARPPDVVLTDVMMPRRDGFALLAALREDPRTRSIPVIILSARAGEEARVEGLDAGADDYLVKPFAERELLARVRIHVELAAARKGERERTGELETLNRVGRTLAAELDLGKLVQAATDAATEACGASFGSFFYNVKDEAGESYLLYTLSGVPREAFAKFPMPRNTAIFAPTFRGEGTVRIHDVTKDPRYGRSAPYHGMPPGHLPVRSYLAASVVSRTGEVLGGLFFGHPEPGRFLARHERIIEGIAAQAAIAMDNSRLYGAAEEARRAAVEANRGKDQFLAVLSHELRTPLTSMLGWARLLRAGRLDAGGSVRAIEVIERNATAQAQLIDDILDVSRIITGKLRLDARAIPSISPVVEAAIDAIRPAARAAGVELRAALDPEAGPLVGDEDRLQQVVWNLLSNAVKFATAGGRVDVQARALEGADGRGEVEVRVADDGCGITAEFLPHVFERFKQAETDGAVARARGGLGLGLAIVRHLVEAHGGSIRAESEGEGRGAAFTIRLPRAAAPAARPGGVARPARAEPSLESLRVLIVEDDADARGLMCTILEGCGIRVTAVATADAALAAIRAGPPDVLLSDIGLPGEDGYELIRRVRALGADQGGAIPAAAITAYATLEDRQQVIQHGYQAYLPKPIDPDGLVGVVARLTGRTAQA